MDPRSHDPAPVLAEAIRQRHMEVDEAFLAWLCRVSTELAGVRSPAFYHEVEVSEAQARTWVEASERVLAFGREQMARLRGGTA